METGTGEQQAEKAEELSKLEEAAQSVNAPAAIEKAPRAATKPRRQFALNAREAASLGLLLVLIVLLLITRATLGPEHFQLPSTFEKIQNYLRGALFICGLLVFGRTIELFGINQVRNAVARYNLKRILRLAIGLGVAFIAVSVVFVNWRAAVVSLGLISLILGFALQTPISSFIGWIYILLRRPYRVGDRIQIGDSKGDVIDVGYFDTTLWEFGGEYLSTDHPSGRIIKFPNTNVFNSAVINYSWPLFPYIWNEIKFQVAYDSDLEFISGVMQELAQEEIGESMCEKVQQYRSILAKTAIDQLEVQEKPVVLFRVSDNTWLEAIVRYLVEPRNAGRVKSRLTKRLLERLNKVPDKVLFPKSNLR